MFWGAQLTVFFSCTSVQCYAVPTKENALMKKSVLVLSAMLAVATVVRADDRTDSVNRLQMAGDVLNAIMAAPDKGIPLEVLDNAKCIAVVPHMIKGGFIFGAQGGKGVATCRGQGKGWSAPAFFTIAGGSWGLQIGVEGVDLVMIIQTREGMKHLMSSKFQLGGDASAAAGPVGRHASGNTDWKLNTEILTYSRAKGIFAGLTLNGNVVREDDDSTKAIYGPGVNYGTILTGGVPATPPAQPFLGAVRSARAKALAK
jgi:SH3 domain-containing YSC84-like protein 1